MADAGPGSVDPVPRRPAAAVAALGAWTVFVWSVRAANVAGDDGATGLAVAAGLAKSGYFLLNGAAVLALLVPARRGRAGATARLAALVRVLAAVTVVVWLVDAVDIVAGDHGTAFVAVHLGLAAVSVALAAAGWWAQSQLRRRNRATSTRVSTTISPSAKG